MMNVINSATNTSTKTAKSKTSDASVIVAQMPAKTIKKVKKSEFDLLAFLIKEHGEALIYKMDIPSNIPWHSVLTRSNISANSAMLFLVDKNNVILYIGQTNNIYNYAYQTHTNNPTMQVATVYAVLHENASKYVHAVSAYRATFKPVFNSDRGTRFVFSPVNAVLNVTTTNVSSTQWIKDNPNAKYTQFIDKFGDKEMRKLCRLHSISYSFATLKSVILKTK